MIWNVVKGCWMEKGEVSDCLNRAKEKGKLK